MEEEGARLVVIDSLNGYLNAMAEERAVLVQLHELLTYLGARGILTLLTVAQHGMVGATMVTPLDASYLADTVILLRYFEAAGQVRQAIAVMKKRSGPHERSLREFRLGPGLAGGPAAARVPGGAIRGTHLCGRKGVAAGPWRAIALSRSRILILAPAGRDAALVAGDAGARGHRRARCARARDLVAE